MAPSLPSSNGSWYEKICNSKVYTNTKSFAENSAIVGKKLMISTGKAAWIAGTTILILVVPLIIEMDREQQLQDMEAQQGLLGVGGAQAQMAPPK